MPGRVLYEDENGNLIPMEPVPADEVAAAGDYWVVVKDPTGGLTLVPVSDVSNDPIVESATGEVLVDSTTGQVLYEGS